MYHMFNLYRGLPFPSPALDSETALGFWHATLSRQEGGIHGFTGHLNKAAGPSIWSVNVHHVVRRVGSRAVEAMSLVFVGQVVGLGCSVPPHFLQEHQVFGFHR